MLALTAKAGREATVWRCGGLTCEMYPGGTWMGGMDPLGDIMGTSAGPGRDEKEGGLVQLFIYLSGAATLAFAFVSQRRTCWDTNKSHTQTVVTLGWNSCGTQTAASRVITSAF